MSSTEAIFIGHLITLILLLNLIRFKQPSFINRLLLVGSVFSVVVSATFLFQELFTFLLFILIITTTVTFKGKGAMLSTIFSLVVLFFFEEALTYTSLFVFIVFGAVMFIIAKLSTEYLNTNSHWKNLLLKNSRQLNVIREVSIAMQQTRELDKVLHIIMTSVTAGHGLGFNRAMVFLHDATHNQLQGIVAIGPLNAKEGLEKWKDIAENKYRLIDLISNLETEKIDSEFNDIVRSLTIPLDDDNTFKSTLQSGKHAHIIKPDPRDKVLSQFVETFQMKELVVVPLIYQGTKVGILLIDNPVTLKPITEEEIDSVIPLASQAASAIQQSKLYKEIEQMALKDGLTGLWNQRSLQSRLADQFPLNAGDKLSMIMIDIDFFKVFNDTHGHLLGNAILEQLAGVMVDSIRSEDLAFRFGGEEFSIILPNTNKDAAFLIAERLRKNVESTYFKGQQSQPNKTLTITLGVVCSDQLHSLSPNGLIAASDQALYTGKVNGKNQVVCYEEQIDHE